jgi:hypothetical protein
MFGWRSSGLVRGRRSVAERDSAVVATVRMLVKKMCRQMETYIDDALATLALLEADDLQ